jgi:hypothetical protein
MASLVATEKVSTVCSNCGQARRFVLRQPTPAEKIQIEARKRRKQEQFELWLGRLRRSKTRSCRVN